MKKIGISLTLRFMFVGLAFSIPFFAVLDFMITEKSKLINFTNHEIDGTLFSEKLVSLTGKIGSHKIFYHSSKKNIEIEKTAFEDFSKSIQTDLQDLEKQFKTYEDSLKLSQDSLSKEEKSYIGIDSIKESWSKIYSGDVLDKSEEYEKILSYLYDLMAYVSNTSELVLDPDLDSYSMMDVNFIAFPNLLKNIEQSFSSILKISSNNDMDHIIHSHILSSRIKENIDRVKDSAELAAKEDIKYYDINKSLQESIIPDILTLHIEIKDKFLSSIQKTMELKPTKDFSQINLDTMKKSSDLWLKSLRNLNELLEIRKSTLEEDKKKSAILILLTWIFAWIFAFFLQTTITKPVKRILSQLTEVSHVTKISSSQLYQTSQMSSKAVAEESAAIQETVSAMAEITSMLAQTSDHTNSASSAAQTILNQTNVGTEIMEQMTSSMTGIAESNSRLKEITKIIEDITNQTNVINDIVFKTQLLAVNASIEAARAGHHGKGFSVVANEVANLASTSGKAAAEIRSLLNESKTQVSSILENTTDSVNNGQQVSNQAVVTFNDISRSVTDIVDKIRQIHEATKEQEIGIKQTSEAMTHLNASTQKNNILSKENATLSEDLKTQSERIERIAMGMNYVIMGNENLNKKTKRRSHLDEILQESSVETENENIPKKQKSKNKNYDLVDKIIKNIGQKNEEES